MIPHQRSISQYFMTQTLPESLEVQLRILLPRRPAQPLSACAKKNKWCRVVLWCADSKTKTLIIFGLRDWNQCEEVDLFDMWWGTCLQDASKNMGHILLFPTMCRHQLCLCKSMFKIATNEPTKTADDALPQNAHPARHMRKHQHTKLRVCRVTHGWANYCGGAFSCQAYT